ncbi:ABC transporter substrate-binding protein [Granulosicoccaceae sp. 1_MG-2023]|nr:ABC transporter substrate-binding protein [Granulosicoccaceae sp. 1_MG-2023]
MQPVAGQARRLWRRGLVLLSCWLCAGSAFAGTAPQRVVSMNLCTDQLLVLLADPEKILSVSYLSAEQHSSYVADTVLGRGYPLNHNLPEEIIPLKPDLVVTGMYLHQSETRLMREAGLRVETFPVFNRLADVKSNIRKMAQLLGESTRGEELIAAMDARQAALTQALPESGPRAVAYHARGYTQGRNTLLDELMTLAGFHNIARDFDIEGYGSIGLEALAGARADVMISSEYAPGTRSAGQYFLQHPVLKRLFPEQKQRIELQTRNLICGGPMNLDALQTLIEYRHALAD